MYWFSADQHFGHSNIIKYCDRPFKDVDEMDAIIIKNFNEVVTPDDTTVHVGDFTLKSLAHAGSYIERLNGKHVFIKGGHDYWMKDKGIQIWEQEINGIYVVACHYPFRSWPRSFHGSINLCGHTHGKLEPLINQYDVGVDVNKYYPVSFIQVIERINRRNKSKELPLT